MEKKNPSSTSTSSCSASTTSSSSSSSSDSRNPPPATQPYDEILQRFQTLWSNNEQINGVHQEQRFPYLGSSSSSNPSIVADEFQRYNDFNNRATAQAQLMAVLALINGGGVLNSYNDLVGNYSSLMNYGLDVNLVNLFNRYAINQQPSNGYTSEDQTSPPGYLSTSSSSIDDEDFDARNLRDKLIDSKGWPVEKVLKILSNDPSLLDEINPNDIVMVAHVKLGSLYLQRILEDRNPLYFIKIFEATLNDMFRLMNHSEGTYVIRKLHSLCGSSHMNQIVGKIMLQRDELKYTARNEYGADTLTKLIRVLDSTNPLLLKWVLDSLTTECVDIMGSKPGSSLFRSCLKYLNSRQNQILHNMIATHCIKLATDDSGYVSLIALIENTPNPYKEELLFKISNKAVGLSQDPKGNYVIQAILKLQIPKFDILICRNLVGSYLCLSMHKCASNVVEKCIESSMMEYPILELICSHKLHLLSQDPMGNYVVQKALNTTHELKRLDLYDSLVAEIQPYLKVLQYHPIGRNVFRMINKTKVIMRRFV